MADISGSLLSALSKLKVERIRVTKQIEAIESILRLQRPSAELEAGRERRRRMTMTERRAVSRRMKAYWAKRKGGSRKRKARAA